MKGKNITKRVEKTLWGLCLVKKRNGDHPAAVVGAILNQNWFIDDSGFPPPPIAIQLKRRIDSLGGMGTVRGKNRLGYCAEVGAANKLLRTRMTLPANRVQFTDAIRPRTMQRIPMCSNCIDTFK